MGDEKKQAAKTKSTSSFIPILICAIALPTSIFLWIGNVAFSIFVTGIGSYSFVNDGLVIGPIRWLTSTVIPLSISVWGLRKNSLDKSGAFLGVFVGFILTLTNYCFLACLMTFFFSSSKATKFRSERKGKLEADYKEGGRRNWIQVLCNGGMATELALLYLLDAGCGERPIDFVRDYRSSWLSIGVLGSLACCNGDTWASELGSVIGSSEPVLITTRKKVPRGTNGGVTLPGIIVSLLGGLLVGISFYVTVLYAVDQHLLERSPPQWPIIAAGAFAGLAGSLVDSVLGATLQYSGMDEKTRVIVEHPGPKVRHISGIQLFDNHSVNLISSIIMGLITPPVANWFWTR